MQARSELSPDAVKVFDAVVGAGEVDADDLPTRTGLARDRVHLGVAELVRGGLASVQRRSSDRLRVRIDGDRAVHSLVRHGTTATDPGPDADLLRARSSLATVLEGRITAGVGAETIVDVQVLQERLETLAGNLRREVLILAAGTRPTEAELAAAHDADRAVLERGVSMAFVYPQDVLDAPYLRSYAEDLVRAGALSRFADDVPCRMWVFDRCCAVVPIDGRSARHGAYVVTGGPFVKGLWHWASTLWRHGLSLEEVIRDEPVRPSPLERRVLLMMNSGITDEAAARQIGVTDRTFRRYVASLLHRLGATSRFQAGVRAVERGWL